MDLQIAPISCNASGWFGDVQQLNGTHLLFVANHAYQQPDGSWAMKIPAGAYTCQLDPHAQLQHGAPFAAYEVTGVPEHWGILFHIGNFPQLDSEGCFLLGTDIQMLAPAGQEAVPAVVGSGIAFDKFMALQNGGASFRLTVLPE